MRCGLALSSLSLTFVEKKSGGPAQRQHGGGLRAAEDRAVAERASKTLINRWASDRAASRWHAHVALNERGFAYESALHGAAALVQDVAGQPCGRGWLCGSGRRASAQGAPQVREGGEAKPRPERLHVQIGRPGAVVASEEKLSEEHRRELAPR